MFVIDGDHLKRWILARWEEADEPPEAADILDQIDREGDWMHYAYKITIEVKEKRGQPEIILCKDCKHFWLGQCGLNGLTWSYDSFCSRAERREE